ncbi:MAG: hypothetical protein D6739_12605, partial [Nitrospirae bacterium]
LTLTTADGTVVAAADDSDGLDPAAGGVAPADATYWVRVAEARGAGGPAYRYRVTASVGPVAAGEGYRHLLVPASPDDEAGATPAGAAPLAAGESASGWIGADGDADAYAVAVAAGERLTFDVDAEADGSELDATLTLIAADGTTVLATSDDTDGLDPRLTHTFAAAGTVYAVVTDLFGEGGEDFFYRLSVHR